MAQRRRRIPKLRPSVLRFFKTAIFRTRCARLACSRAGSHSARSPGGGGDSNGSQGRVKAALTVTTSSYTTPSSRRRPARCPEQHAHARLCKWAKSSPAAAVADVRRWTWVAALCYAHPQNQQRWCRLPHQSKMSSSSSSMHPLHPEQVLPYLASAATMTTTTRRRTTRPLFRLSKISQLPAMLLLPLLLNPWAPPWPRPQPASGSKSSTQRRTNTISGT